MAGSHRDSFDGLHVLWPWGLFSGANVEETTRRCATMIEALFLARSLGCVKVWTMQDVYLPDSTIRDLDHLARFGITASASAVIVGS